MKRSAFDSAPPESRDKAVAGPGENSGIEVNQLRKIKVLFLCTGNSCRSQMAQGWANHLKGDLITAFSAGIEARGLNPMAVEVMKEAGVDISSQESETLDGYISRSFDAVITVCGHAGENCPFFPGAAKVIHAGFDDPPEQASEIPDRAGKLVCYRRVRDEIRAFVETLPESLNRKHQSAGKGA